jgi:4-hydroxy-tetrahydrodipicolinate reductase
LISWNILKEVYCVNKNINKKMIKIGITGATGRMGKMLIETLLNPQIIAQNVKFSAALEHEHHSQIGNDATLFLGQQSNVLITANMTQFINDCDVIIDFTRPNVTLNLLSEVVKQQKKIVIGTTGFEAEQKEQLQQFAQNISMVVAPNMSLGVNVTSKVLYLLTRLLGPTKQYDIEIIEAHHRHKVDAPSGTALKLGEVCAQALEVPLEQVACYAREGITGARAQSEIGFSTIRGGDIVGDHTVLFASMGERIELSHKSSGRQSYAQGAVNAAIFLATKNSDNGLYDMDDVFNLKTLIQQLASITEITE